MIFSQGICRKQTESIDITYNKSRQKIYTCHCSPFLRISLFDGERKAGRVKYSDRQTEAVLHAHENTATVLSRQAASKLVCCGDFVKTKVEVVVSRSRCRASLPKIPQLQRLKILGLTFLNYKENAMNDVFSDFEIVKCSVGLAGWHRR